MAKRYTRGGLLKTLRGERITGSVSKQMGRDRSWLSRVLAGDETAPVSEAFAAQVLDAIEAVKTGKPTA